MSIVLTVGQAGNAVGAELWELLCEEKASRAPSGLFRLTGEARGVMVDSEPKVMGRLKRNRSLRREAMVCDAGGAGRGNNWAYGYSAGQSAELQDYPFGTEPGLVARVMDVVRKEAEACDVYTGCMMLHSVAGGTGSGLGCRLAQEMRDAYPINYLLSAAIAPFDTGDTPMQVRSLACEAPGV